VLRRNLRGSGESKPEASKDTMLIKRAEGGFDGSAVKQQFRGCYRTWTRNRRKQGPITVSYVYKPERKMGKMLECMYGNNIRIGESNSTHLNLASRFETMANSLAN
jgi:hypothetical protein